MPHHMDKNMSTDKSIRNTNIEKAAGKLVVFEDAKIRRTRHNEEWYFSIIDIVEVLTGSLNPRRYWSDLKLQVINNEGFDKLYGKSYS